MSIKEKMQRGELMKGLFLAQLIILFHVLIIAILGVTVLLLGGLARNLVWIILGVIAVTLILTYVIYRRTKTQGKDLLRDLDQAGMMHGRPLEISFMGGMMSFKVGTPNSPKALEANQSGSVPQLEDIETVRKRELADLAQLLADDMISIEEYTSAKQKILAAN